ncbi:uncharacterized protein LOC133912826 isoform X2 [Phragmites australis]|uniref:uncharacterized protein LOC133912826 isoform X2 n=1 Tax=Phragmites australis TaxID=29695 RepID=UPI002D769BB0|nr:uncharacterized protein LOC133912826 isoform X2 [Phragmites australis]
MAGVEVMVASAVVKEAIRGLAAAAGGPMAKLWRSCKADLEDMRSTLSLLEAGFRDAEQRSGSEEGVRVWLGQLKAVARDISAVLDQPPPPPWKVFAKLSLVNKIEELKEKLKVVEEKRRIFGFSLYNSAINENVVANYVAWYGDTDTGIRIRGYRDTTFSKNSNTGIRRSRRRNEGAAAAPFFPILAVGLSTAAHGGSSSIHHYCHDHLKSVPWDVLHLPRPSSD